MPKAIEGLLREPVDVPACESVAEWWPRHRSLAAPGDAFASAISGGFAADRVGWAFASGYQAALRALFADAPADRICALCVTEEEGNAPKAIRTTLRESSGRWMLNGAKRWTTLGPDGAVFFVAARDETASGDRAAIRIARVDSGTPGLHLEPMPPAKFVPEVPHARLRFEDVAAAALLPGDGYDAYVRPFRTVEDIHVHAAILAYLLREARRLKWPEAWAERAFALVNLMDSLARKDSSAPATHLALSGALALGDALIRDAEDHWRGAAADPAAARWARDRELLKVAGGIRAQRSRRAWERL